MSEILKILGTIIFKMAFTTEIDWIKYSYFFNWFSISKYFVLFEVIFLLRLDSLTAKSVFVIKFACASLATKFSAANFVNFGVVIHFSCLRSESFFAISLIFVS